MKYIGRTMAVFIMLIFSIVSYSSMVFAPITTTNGTFSYSPTIANVGESAIAEFEYISKTAADVEASQGVATDGTDFWTTSGGTGPPPNNMYLYKYNSAWALQDSQNCSDDITGDLMAQVNHLFHFQDHVYVGANNYNNETYRSLILKYDADTLDHVSTIELKDESDWIDGWTEGCSYYNNSWWVIWTNRMKVTQYSDTWDYMGEYDLSYSVGGHSAAKYQGIIWRGNYAYFNIHYNGDPDKIDAYHFNGTAFTEVARLDQPHPDAGQGFSIDRTDNETVYFAIRGGADNEKVCWANIVEDLGGSWLSGWTYRRGVEIQYVPGAGNNYSIPVDVGYDGEGAIVEFDYISKTAADVEASQGVATDGTDFWTTSGGTGPPPNNMYLYKYNSAWALQDSQNCSDDITGDLMAQVNHLFHFQDHVYVGANNYNNETYRSLILKYDADTLDHVSTIELKDESDWIDGWTEGCSYYNNSWWVIWTNRMKVTQYSDTWDYMGEYDLSYSVGGHSAAKYQGIIWRGNYAYFNIHYNGDPDKIDAYHFNGTAFTEVARLDQPHPDAGQGFSIDRTDNETVYFAIRGGADNEKVCWANIVLEDPVDIDMGGKCEFDFDDVRFTDGDGVSLLSYWKHQSGSSARFWVNVRDSLSIKNQTIYCYYGNPSANSLSNGSKVFPFFDDFDRADSGTIGEGWTDEIGDASHENNITLNTLSVKAYEHYYSHIEKAAPSLTDFCVEVMINCDNDSSSTWHPSIWAYWDSYKWVSIGVRMDASNDKHHGYDNDAGVVTNHWGDTSSSDTWYYYRILVNSSYIVSDYSQSWNNYIEIYNIARGASFAGAASLILVGKGHSVDGGSYPNADLDNNGGVTGVADQASYYDNIFVRKYVYPEPLQGMWTAEIEEPEWDEINDAKFILPISWSPEVQFSYDAFFIFLGLIMIPASTMYLARGGRKDMSANKLFFALVILFLGFGFLIGGIMP